MRIELTSLTSPSVAPSLLAADQGNLLSEVRKAEAAGARLIHFDVMDGRFVENISFFGHELDEVLPSTRAYRDVHLMVEDVVETGRRFLALGADAITFHVEALEKAGIRPEGLRALFPDAAIGVSLKPGTPVSALFPFLPQVDLVLLMSVEPGRGGQPFLEDAPERASAIRKAILSTGRRIYLSIDGGINRATAKKALASGVDILVAGSYLFGHSDFEERMKGLLDD